jgi:hypothetical protein
MYTVPVLLYSFCMGMKLGLQIKGRTLRMFEGRVVRLFLIFINCKWGFTWWQWFTIRHDKQITHITQNNTTIK